MLGQPASGAARVGQQRIGVDLEQNILLGEARQPARVKMEDRGTFGMSQRDPEAALLEWTHHQFQLPRRSGSLQQEVGSTLAVAGEHKVLLGSSDDRPDNRDLPAGHDAQRDPGRVDLGLQPFRGRRELRDMDVRKVLVQMRRRGQHELVPDSAAARAMARAWTRSAGPSSIPGRMWQWMSIRPSIAPHILAKAAVEQRSCRDHRVQVASPQWRSEWLSLLPRAMWRFAPTPNGTQNCTGLDRVGLAVAITLLAPAVVVYLSFNAGGFFPVAPGIAAIIFAQALLVRTITADQPFEGL